MLKIIFDEIIEKLNALLNIWSQRNLTIKERITILKAKALSLVTYMSTCLYIPKHIIETIDKALYNFVLKKKHHVRRPALIESPSKGSIKMPDFNPHSTVWGPIGPWRIISMRCAKAISITFLRFYDFGRLSIVIPFQTMLSNSMLE